MNEPKPAAGSASSVHAGGIVPKGAARPQMKPRATRKTGCPVTRIRHGQVQHCSKPKGHDGEHGARGVTWRATSGDAA